MEQIDIYEAKTRLSERVTAASQGAEFILARNDRPLARLVPLLPTEREDVWQGRGFGSCPEIGVVAADFDAPLPEEVVALFEGVEERPLS